jgi:hypothetical protein
MSSVRASFVGLAALASACGSSTPTRPPGAPPTPATVTMDHPGGDARDPHEAALLRQVTEAWGFQEDKDGQLRIPLVDSKNYERVRYWTIEHFVGFKYGSDFHTLNSVFVLDVPAGAPLDSESCLKRAEQWAHPQIQNFQIKLADQQMMQSRWHDTPIFVISTDGYLDFGLERRRFSAAYAAYPAYSDACLVFGFAVPWREHEALAKQTRDRWIKEGVPRIEPLTKTRPYRK